MLTWAAFIFKDVKYEIKIIEQIIMQLCKRDNFMN